MLVLSLTKFFAEESGLIVPSNAPTRAALLFPIIWRFWLKPRNAIAYSYDRKCTNTKISAVSVVIAGVSW
uniref:Uncharacterized protein n=1 Tax=Cucumis melo TaxID=3656 RepID=A0A9I9EMD6_CUCME